MVDGWQGVRRAVTREGASFISSSAGSASSVSSRSVSPRPTLQPNFDCVGNKVRHRSSSKGKRS